MVRVLLYDHVGTGLIIPAQTGVSYLNQVGGTACLQYELEGLFVPYGNDVAVPSLALMSLENELSAHFERDGSGGFDARDADVVDRLMAASPRWENVSVNRDRLDECVEAWVHVWIDGFGDYIPLVEGLGLGPHAAILTWRADGPRSRRRRQTYRASISHIRVTQPRRTLTTPLSKTQPFDSIVVRFATSTDTRFVR